MNDFYTYVASLIFDKDLDRVVESERKEAKNRIYQKIYKRYVELDL